MVTHTHARTTDAHTHMNNALMHRIMMYMYMHA